MTAWTTISALAPPVQPLIDATPEGGVLRLPAGTYAAPAVIHRPLTLDGSLGATLDGAGHGTLIRIQSPGVTVRRMHLIGSGESHDAMDSAILVESDHVRIENNAMEDVLFGVVLSSASNGRICGNTITSKVAQAGMRGDAIRIWNGHANRVDGNEVFKARDVSLANAPRNVVVGNRIRAGRYGMQLVFSPGNRIEGNRLEDNLTGIAVLYSDDVAITGNDVRHSPGVSGVGVIFKESSQGVVEVNTFLDCAVGARINSPTHPLNVVYFRRNRFAHNVAGMDFYGENGGHVIQGNLFEHNLRQVTVSGPMSARGNNWSGNSWDDYQGFDRNGDAVGDVPYEMFAFSDRIWMENPLATFFRNSPAMELLDFLERLAPFANPQLVLQDPAPLLTLEAGVPADIARGWAAFVPSCSSGGAP